MQEHSHPSTLLWVIVGIVALVFLSPFLVTHSTSPQQKTSSSPSSLAPGTRSYYVALARQDALAVHIDPECFVRQINQESGFNPHALSPAGAIGIAQFMPETARAWGIDPRDPEQSLKGAARLMAHLLSTYHGDYAKALAAYNAGENAVNRAVLRGGASWQAYIPSETQHYIAVIL
jgi:soluble lytic murein transglycosylase-like protein